MNKQELIGKIRALPYEEGVAVDTLKINRDGLIKLIEQFDEPQKPVVKQFVADWYEEHKDDFETNLFNAIDLITRDFEDGDLSEFEEWFIDGKTKPFQTLVNMHQFGYTVEKEKRYLVKIVGMDNINGYLSYNKKLKKWFFGIASESRPYRSKHTRKQLEEAGFGWVFDCPGIEIEEVGK